MNVNTDKDREEKFLLTFSDIFSLFRQSKKKIFLSALILGILGTLFALIKPIRYQSEGSFREKGIKSNNVASSSVVQLLGGSLIGSESEAASLMTSRKILKDVIDKLHLQATLEAVPEIETLSTLIKSNLSIAWNAFTHPHDFVLKEICCPLAIEKLKYTGEIPLKLLLSLEENGNYEVRDLLNPNRLIGVGKLKEIFHIGDLSFTLASAPQFSESLIPQFFCLQIDPLSHTVKEMCKILQVEPAKLDKSLLKIKYEHRNRHLASAVVNTIMEIYQSYLKNYHQDMALQQLDYLSLRRDQLRNNLVDVMQKHARFLANDLYSSGFIESDKEMDFLAKSLHEYKQKLLDNELEIKRLENIKPNHFAYFDRYSGEEGEPSTINNIFSEMRLLKQQRDTLEIDLQKKSRQQGVDLQQSFEQQFNELKEVQLYLTEIRQMTAQFQEGIIPDGNVQLMNDSRFLFKRWFERLQNTKQNSSNWQEIKEGFQFYLNNLQRLFEVHERILQERLIHQQNPSQEYQGINLEVATELYLDYSKQLILIEGNIRQNLFFIHQIEDPNFEISSLSAGLNDPVSLEMIRKSSELILNLRDENNQSVREQERIKEELFLKRTFLNMHLKQMVQLMELNKQLIDEKIFALQNVSLELVHQRVSLLEKNLRDHLQSRLDNLEQERILIKRHLESIHQEMTLLPDKWVSEQLLLQEMDANQLIVEEIAKLVESKNISHNLDVIQSAPVDLALPSLQPLAPKVLLWGFLGFLLGGGFGAFVILGKALYRGIPVSIQHLESMGYHVSGTLTSAHHSQAKNSNYDTLRRLQLYFDTYSSSNVKEAKMLLLIEGEGPNYASGLAHLLVTRGCRVVTLELNFKTEKKTSSPVLLEYLKGELTDLPIRKGEYGDWISTGQKAFTVEMASLPAFQKLIEQLKMNYDWILVSSNILPLSIEAESLLPLFSNVVITLENETIEELGFYTYFLKRHPHYRLTCLLSCS